MPLPDYVLTIDGEAVDPRRLECHYQSEPYPGGHLYELVIHDKDTILHAGKEFGAGNKRQVGAFKATHFFAFLGGMKSIKIGRANPPLFWANTIDEVDLSEDTLTLKGVCSPHVSKRNGNQ